MKFYTIRELKTNIPGLGVKIPEKFWDIFSQEECEECGTELVCNEDLTIFRCPNDNCTIRLAGALDKVLHNLGIKGVAATTISKYISDNNSTMRYYEKKAEYASRGEQIPSILTLREQRLSNPHWIRSKLEFFANPPRVIRDELKSALEIPRTFAEAVRIMNITDLISRSDAIFKDCCNMEQFQEKTRKSGGIYNWLRENLVKGTATTLVNNIVAKLWSNRQELKEIPEYFNIIKETLVSIKVVITGHISSVTSDDGGHLSKDEFIGILNNKLIQTGKRIMLDKRVSGNTSILVADSDGTSNLAAAENINSQREKGSGFPLIAITTAAELSNMVDMIAQEWIQANERKSEDVASVCSDDETDVVSVGEAYVGEENVNESSQNVLGEDIDQSTTSEFK